MPTDVSRDFSDRLRHRDSIGHNELSSSDRRTESLIGIIIANYRRSGRKQVRITSLEGLPVIRGRLRLPLGDQYHEKPGQSFVIFRFNSEFFGQAPQRLAESVYRFLQFALLQVRPGNVDVCFMIEQLRIDRSFLEILNAYRITAGIRRPGQGAHCSASCRLWLSAALRLQP